MSAVKKERIRKKSCTDLRKLLREFSSEQWLYLIRQLNHFIRNENDDLNASISFKAEFCTTVADLALRLAPSDPSITIPKPTQLHFKQATHLFFSCDESPSELLKYFGIGAIPLMVAWQNRFHYTPNNILGRMLLLYKEYHNDVIEAIGVTVYDIYIITLAIIGIYDKRNVIVLNQSMIYHQDIEHLSEEKIKNFFSFFATNKENYHTTAKSLKIYDNCIGKFNLMNQYPIIELENNQYIIPIIEQLIDSVSSNLYYHILAHKQKQGRKASRAYLDDFGIVLENYVLASAQHIFGDDNVVRAEEIVTNAKGDRCEAVIFYENKALALEVKKLNFKLNAIENVDVEYIRGVLHDHLVKAYGQVENTLKYVEQEEKYGLIVIPDSMLSPSSLKDYLKNEFPVDGINYDTNILMCTLSAYESLMGNSKETIFKALYNAQNRTPREGNDIIMTLRDMHDKDNSITFKNELCDQALKDSLSKLKIKNPYI